MMLAPRWLTLGLVLPCVLSLQSTSHLITDAYRSEFRLNAARITAAADDMPPDRYAYRPTPGQMSFAEVVVHVVEGNYDIGAVVGGVPTPIRTPLSARDSKEVLVASLKKSFEFCDKAFAGVRDDMLTDSVPEYGTRASGMFNTINHWSDHYSQMAIYLRLSGLLPPTARGH